MNDPATLKSLEYFKIKELVSSLTQTEMGQRLVLEMRPTIDQDRLENEFNNLEYLLSLKNVPELSLFFDFLSLIETRLKKAAFLDGLIIAKIKNVLKEVDKLRKFFLEKTKGMPAGFADYVIKRLKDIKPLITRLESQIDEMGEIKPDANPRFHQLYSEIYLMREKIVEKLNKILMATPKLFSQENFTLIGERYVLPVKIEAVSKIPGITHDYSQSEKTAFVEPLSIIDDNNQLVWLHRLLGEEKLKILKELTEEILKWREAFKGIIEAIGYLDLLNAKATFVQKFNCARVNFNRNGTLKIVNGRHPILESSGQEVVPLNLTLSDGINVLLISGPNAGGKTVALKTVGIIALLAYSGIFPPVGSGTELPLLREIFADIGDEQSLENGVSSFYSHIKKLKQILTAADAKTLILLDEIGANTSPEEGDSLAMAVLEELSRLGCKTLATTHSARLKMFVYNKPKMLNASMAYNERPTYRLIMGIPGASSAFAIAKTLGLPEKIIEQARSFVKEDFFELGAKLQALEQEIKQWREANEKCKQTKEKLAKLILEYETKKKEVEKKLREWRREILKEKESFFLNARREFEQLVKRIKEENAQKNSVKNAKLFFEYNFSQLQSLKEQEREETRIKELTIGQKVYIEKLKSRGVIKELKDGLVKVSLGKLNIKVAPNELTPISEDSKQEKLNHKTH